MNRRVTAASAFARILIATVVVTTSGCGTVANFSGGQTLAGTPVASFPVPYGGVASNVKLAIDRPEMTHFAAFDLCLCLVSDTLTLPWVVYYDIREVAEWLSSEESEQKPLLPPVPPVDPSN